MTRKWLLLLPLFLLLWACRHKKPVVLMEEKHISGKLYITLPANYTIEPSKGPDFSVYYFYPEDTSQSVVWSAGCYIGGHPHRFGLENNSCTIDSIHGSLLDQPVMWTVYNCDTSFTAETVLSRSEINKIHTFISARSRETIKDVVRIFEGMKEKP